MKLDEYLQENRLSLARFGKLANLSAPTVLRARDALVVPSRKTMERIEAATSGVVTRVDLISVVKIDGCADKANKENE